MHRRQYLPGSHIKFSRTKLARENAVLKETRRREAELQAALESGRKAAEERKQNSGIRGFLNKAKRALTKPLSFRRRAS